MQRLLNWSCSDNEKNVEKRPCSPSNGQVWHNCRRMIYVSRSAQRGSSVGHWPIPESFWPDINKDTLVGHFKILILFFCHLIIIIIIIIIIIWLDDTVNINLTNFNTNSKVWAIIHVSSTDYLHALSCRGLNLNVCRFSTDTVVIIESCEIFSISQEQERNWLTSLKFQIF